MDSKTKCIALTILALVLLYVVSKRTRERFEQMLKLEFVPLSSTSNRVKVGDVYLSANMSAIPLNIGTAQTGSTPVSQAPVTSTPTTQTPSTGITAEEVEANINAMNNAAGSESMQAPTDSVTGTGLQTVQTAPVETEPKDKKTTPEVFDIYNPTSTSEITGNHFWLPSQWCKENGVMKGTVFESMDGSFRATATQVNPDDSKMGNQGCYINFGSEIINSKFNYGDTVKIVVDESSVVEQPQVYPQYEPTRPGTPKFPEGTEYLFYGMNGLFGTNFNCNFAFTDPDMCNNNGIVPGDMFQFSDGTATVTKVENYHTDMMIEGDMAVQACKVTFDRTVNSQYGYIPYVGWTANFPSPPTMDAASCGAGTSSSTSGDRPGGPSVHSEHETPIMTYKGTYYEGEEELIDIPGNVVYLEREVCTSGQPYSTSDVDTGAIVPGDKFGFSSSENYNQNSYTNEYKVTGVDVNAKILGTGWDVDACKVTFDNQINGKYDYGMMYKGYST